ncbi:MAG: hypothetical protein QM726_07160 [Chitinophagaceae bacterium]
MKYNRILQNSFIAFMLTGCLALFGNNRLQAQDQVDPNVQADANASITYQDFYDDLSPYGTWLDYPSYGHVWHPNISGEFRPYLTNGYWNYSNEGWLWMSDYSWGWAPFHYGRWIYDDTYGWLWVPGYEWSPAWVTWGGYDNFYSWAPLMPGVYVGAQFGSWRPPAFYWNVCDRGHIYDHNIVNVVERRDMVANNIGRINIINNFSNTRLHGQFYAKGPDINDVRKYTNQKINTISVRGVNKIEAAGRSESEVKMFRPSVANPQPRSFKRIDNANPIMQNEDHVNNHFDEQRQNIERLPVRTAPAPAFGGGRGEGGRRR